MNRHDFVKRIAERKNFNQEDIEVFMDDFADVLFEEIKKGTNIRIKGLFSIYVTDIGERKGRNGNTLPPTKRVTARLSKRMRTAFKKTNETGE